MGMRGLSLLALTCTASAWWKDEDTHTRGEVRPVITARNIAPQFFLDPRFCSSHAVPRPRALFGRPMTHARLLLPSAY